MTLHAGPKPGAKAEALTLRDGLGPLEKFSVGSRHFVAMEGAQGGAVFVHFFDGTEGAGRERTVEQLGALVSRWPSISSEMPTAVMPQIRI